MGIVIFIIGFILFERRVLKYDRDMRLTLNVSLVLYILFSIVLNQYLKINFGWAYGIPGADMEAHYEGAKAIAEGTSLNDLAAVNKRFVLSFSNIGYILYAYVVALVVFEPIIISIDVSLQIFYAIQSMIAIIAMLNIADFISKQSTKAFKFVLITLLSCMSVLQMSAVLMRDIWIVFLISILLYECKTLKCRHWLCVLCIVLVTLLRSYTILITIPIYMAFGLKWRKLAIIVSGGFTCIFCFGQIFIDKLAQFMSILWHYSFDLDFVAMIRYILFPNIITQTQNVQNLTIGYHVIFGGNTEWIYYLLAAWNVFVFPLVGLGIIKCIHKKRITDMLIWSLSIINVSILYNIFYSSVSEPRHKLLLLFGLMFFLYEGIKDIRKGNMILYIICVSIVLMGLLLVIS